jgi:hypothetical protein
MKRKRNKREKRGRRKEREKRREGESKKHTTLLSAEKIGKIDYRGCI